MKEIIDFIESGSHEIKIGWIDKNTFGFLNNRDDVICLNLFLLIADTFIHEYMHYKYQEFCTGMNYEEEEKFVNEKTKNKILKMKIGEIMEISRTVMLHGADEYFFETEVFQETSSEMFNKSTK